MIIIFKRIFVIASAISLLAVVTPSTFAGDEEIFGDFPAMRKSLSKCERAGYYKVIVKNGLAGQAFPLPISGTEYREIPSGATEVLEITKEGLDRIAGMLKKVHGVDIYSVLLRENKQPEGAYVVVGEGLPEEEKFVFRLEYCLKGRCDVGKYSPKNCNGYVIVNIIDGHPYSMAEFMEKFKELKVDYAIDANAITFSANLTEQSRTEL